MARCDTGAFGADWPRERERPSRPHETSPRISLRRLSWEKQPPNHGAAAGLHNRTYRKTYRSMGVRAEEGNYELLNIGNS